MQYTFSPLSLVNALVIAIGIGVCLLCFFQITASRHLKKEVRLYFQIFFLLILFYITSHLTRQLLDGMPGDAVHTAIYIITFAEMISAGIMTHVMSLLVLAVSKPEKKHAMSVFILLYALLGAHIAVMSVCAPFDLIYTFDAENIYHRSSLYILSNLFPSLVRAKYSG